MDNTIEIPLISWLFHTITGEDLTLLNLVTLVVAFPMTILFRVITGKYPSEAGFVGPSTSTVDALGSPQIGLWDYNTRIYLGQAYWAFSLFTGVISARGDAGINLSKPEIAAYCGLCVALIPLSLPYSTTGDPQGTDWAEFGLTVAGYLASIMLNLVDSNPEDPTEPARRSCCMALYCIVCLVVYSVIYGAQDEPYWNKISFAACLLSLITSIANPLKFIEELMPVVVVLDVALPLTAGVMTAVDWAESN